MSLGIVSEIRLTLYLYPVCWCYCHELTHIRTLVRDESDRKGMRIVYILKRDAIPNIVLNMLYKYTALQSSFSVNNIALVKGRPQLLNLKEMIHHFVEHRHEVVVRRTKFELKKAEARAHILEGLIIASDNIDEVIAIIRGSANADEAKTIDEYISAVQPYLHLSCEDAWEVSGQNEEEYINIINRFIAITFINHDFDVELLQIAPKEDRDQLRKVFYDEIGRSCRERPQRLLAGVVDRSLVYAFDEVAPEADDDLE